MKYSKEDLITILTDCKYKQITSAYTELNGIKDMLSIAFEPCNSTYIEDNTLEYISSTIDILLNDPNKEFFDTNLIDLITYRLDVYAGEGHLLKDRLDMIFNPFEMGNSSLKYYLYNFEEIVHVILWNFFDDRDFKFPKFDNLYKNIRALDDKHEFKYVIDYNILVMLFAYCYLNDIDDYRLVYDYLNNKEYYLDCIQLQGIYVSETKKEIEEYFYYIIPIIFRSNKENRIIK